MVVFDEVHHAGEQASWGAALSRAFEAAAFRLCLSGTPFRSDGTAIPFVTYEPNERGELVARADYRYRYGRALDDMVVRSVHFPRFGGRTEWAWDGKTYDQTFDDKLSEDQAARRLRTALTKGTFLPTLLGQAMTQLDELRVDDADAGGLVLAIDYEHAVAIEEHMRAINPAVRPTIVAYQDAAAKAKLDAFARSRDPWLVAIRMVSEGVDIPRLRVGVHATNTTTALFFRQAVGRVLRVEKGCEDDAAYYFIPDDPVLRKHAQEMAAERDVALQREPDEVPGGGGGGDSIGSFVPLDSDGMMSSVTYDGELFTAAELLEAEHVRTMLKLPKSLPPARVVQIGRLYRNTPEGSTVATHPTMNVPLRERLDKLRKQNSRIARRIAFTTSVPFGKVEGTLNDRVGISSVKRASEDQLRARLREAAQWLADLTPELSMDEE